MKQKYKFNVKFFFKKIFLSLCVNIKQKKKNYKVQFLSLCVNLKPLSFSKKKFLKPLKMQFSINPKFVVDQVLEKKKNLLIT